MQSIVTEGCCTGSCFHTSKEKRRESEESEESEQKRATSPLMQCWCFGKEDFSMRILSVFAHRPARSSLFSSARTCALRAQTVL